MSDSDLQKQRKASQSCNEDILTDFAFRKVGSSSLYKRGSDAFILSPGISRGRHEKYWFDIREANLNKIGSNVKAWVLLRIVPNWFVFFSIADIRKHMNQKTQDIRVNSGKVWGFYCELNEEKRTIRVVSKNDNSASFSTILLDRPSVKAELSTKVQI